MPLNHYDKFVRVIYTDTDYFILRDYLEENVFHPDLNVIAGHGNLYSIQFGNPFDTFFKNRQFVSTSFTEIITFDSEECYLDLNDENDLAIDMLKDSALDKYFLFSCRTFPENDSENSVGNMFARNAVKGQTIFGAKDTFYGGSSLTLLKDHPFKVSINKNRRNVTVVKRHKLFGEIPLEKKKPINLNEYWNKRRFNRGCRYR